MQKCRHFIVVIVTIAFTSLKLGFCQPCNVLRVELGIVCTCNSTYCDYSATVDFTDKDVYFVYTSSRAGQRMDRRKQKFTRHQFETENDANLARFTLEIDPDIRYQKVVGFGGSFSDAAGININSLSPKTQAHMLRSYFSPEGNHYSMARVPIGGSDFSTRPYTYHDGYDRDFDLVHFSLSTEDFKYKIPYIQAAMKLSNGDLQLLGSPWGPPGWMKTNGEIKEKGYLKGGINGPYYRTWANYFVKFLEEYKKRGISFWGVTTQNQPLTSTILNTPFNTLAMTAEMERDFIAKHLGPTLNSSGYGDLKIIGMDDMTVFLPLWIDTVFGDPAASKYTAGVGVHWYMDAFLPSAILSTVHSRYPDKLILSTEAAAGAFTFFVPIKVHLGSWIRAERYATDIIKDLQHWMNGWIDWNLALNMRGGPNWVNNHIDSTVIVDAKNDRFFKQPTFYVMGHFSKFVRPGAVRIRLIMDTLVGTARAVAFHGPEDMTAVIVLNRAEIELSLVIKCDKGIIQEKMPPKSIQTYVWSNS